MTNLQPCKSCCKRVHAGLQEAGLSLGCKGTRRAATHVLQISQQDQSSCRWAVVALLKSTGEREARHEGKQNIVLHPACRMFAAILVPGMLAAEA
jgi:hypothetical protein